MLIRVGALAVIWALWLCTNDKKIMIKIVLSCRLSTDVPVFSVYGHLFSGWRIATCLRGVCTWLEATTRDTFSLHGWSHNLRIGAPPSP
jgi:hypothetical protein